MTASASDPSHSGSSRRPFDCRHFRGDKPCPHAGGRACHPSAGGACTHYRSLGRMTLVIKLGALGDVLRTTSLLPALERHDPQGSVVWLTQPAAVPLLEQSGCWKVQPWNLDSVLYCESIDWHRVICLDKEEGPTALAAKLEAPQRFGYGRNRRGLLEPLDAASDELFRLGIDDEEKFRRNTLTYPHLIARACGLEWGPNPYVLRLTDAERAWADPIVAGWGKGPFVGLNPGAGEAFAGKRWPMERYVELARRVREAGWTPVCIGGAREREALDELKSKLDGIAVFPGCDFSLRQFMSLVARLKVLVAGDTLAMHIGIGLGVWQVTLFGSTTEREIEFYDRGEALVGRVPCAPCYRRVCPTAEECQQAITVDAVFAAVKRGIDAV